MCPLRLDLGHPAITKAIAMHEQGRFHPLSHRLLWILIRTVALLLIALGMVTAATAFRDAAATQAGVGLFLMLLGLLLERNHPRLLRGRWSARCPKCGGVMETEQKLWEAPDDSPQWYVEYSCPSCQTRYTNDVFGKAIYGWPPRVPYTAPEPEPFTWADGMKTAFALLVIVGFIAFLYWAGLVGNANCTPNCF